MNDRVTYPPRLGYGVGQALESAGRRSVTSGVAQLLVIISIEKIVTIHWPDGFVAIAVGPCSATPAPRGPTVVVRTVCHDPASRQRDSNEL
jgi:hypothetical protein